MASKIRIGSSIETMEPVLLEPHVEFIPHDGLENKACRGDRYIGKPRCRWTYPDRELTGEQFYQLKNLVGDQASATVYIDIPTQTLDLSTYSPIITAYEAIMHWPPEDVMLARYNRWQLPEDGIEFTHLVSI